MEDKAIRGLPWTLLTYAANRLITLATTLVLARLLSPEDFGLVALALVALLLMALFRDLGIGGAFVVREELDEVEKGTFLTIMLVMSIVSAALVAGAAPLLAEVLDEPRLGPVLAVLSITLISGAPAWFYEVVMQRELAFRRRFIAQTVKNVVYVPLALTLAVAGAGVWSLVAGQVAGNLASAVATVALAPYRVRPAFEPGAARRAVAGGYGFMIQGGSALLRQYADYAAVGSILGTTRLGYYAMAYRVAEVPYLSIADPVAKVTFPGFARMRARGEQVDGSFLRMLRSIAFVTCPIGIIASGCAEPFVEAVLGDKWLPMIGPLAVLGLWAALRSLEATAGWLLNSLGEAPVLGLISTLILIPLVPGVVVAAELAGTTAVAVVVLGDVVVAYALVAYFIGRRVGIPLRRQWAALRPVALACAPTWIVVRLTAEAAQDIAPLLVLGASAAAGALAYITLIRLLEPGLISGAMRQVLRSLGRSQPLEAAS